MLKSKQKNNNFVNYFNIFENKCAIFSLFLTYFSIMKLLGVIINAFCENQFFGNPACVINLEKWLPDSILLQIAKQIDLPETSFYCSNEKINLRWFTPDIEMDLCGHATLATAFCFQDILFSQSNSFTFNTNSGTIVVEKDESLFSLFLPIRKGEPSILPESIIQSLNILPVEVYKARDYLLIYKNQIEIENIKIERSYFDSINLDPGGVIISAQGKAVDFVSRYFTPQATILEDPVTGSAHCTLVPYWSEKLNKKKLVAHQLSSSGGTLFCELRKSNVKVSGRACFMREVSIVVDL
jgi:PhzF family phenazine biosynthesis protein